MAEQIWTSGTVLPFNEGDRDVALSIGTSSTEIEVTNATTSSMSVTWVVTPLAASDQIEVDLKKPSLHTLANEAVDSNLENLHIDKGDVNDLVVRRVTGATAAVDVSVEFFSNRRHTTLSSGRVYFLNKLIYMADLDDIDPNG